MNKSGLYLFCLFLILAACSEENKAIQPEIQLRFVEVVEGSQNEKIVDVELVLNIPAEEEIELIYFTNDSTAKADKDFQPINNASVTISAGESKAVIPVTIISDTHLEFTEYFTLWFEEPSNARLSGNFLTVKILDDDSYMIQKDSEGYITPDNYEEMTLIWQDEFDGPEINTENWTFELGAGGWGNQESQTYTDNEQNARIEDGKLKITAIQGGGATYTSARMITKDKQEFTFGRIDIRAKLPEGQGIWPALWMLGANIDEVGWPSCGEIDIMELVGHEPYKTHGTIHFNNNGHTFIGGSYTIGINETFGDEFHVFSILWEHNRVKWYVDYNKFFEFDVSMSGTSYPFNSPHFFIFNIAVGGLWPGYPDETTEFPQSMIIDYIRVFQQEE